MEKTERILNELDAIRRGELETDLRDADLVEVQVDKNGTVWVNIDGTCRLRAQFSRRVIVNVPGSQLHIGGNGDPHG